MRRSVLEKDIYIISAEIFEIIFNIYDPDWYLPNGVYNIYNIIYIMGKSLSWVLLTSPEVDSCRGTHLDAYQRAGMVIVHGSTLKQLETARDF